MYSGPVGVIGGPAGLFLSHLFSIYYMYLFAGRHTRHSVHTEVRRQPAEIGSPLLW